MWKCPCNERCGSELQNLNKKRMNSCILALISKQSLIFLSNTSVATTGKIMRRFLCNEARKFKNPNCSLAFFASPLTHISVDHIHSIRESNFKWENLIETLSQGGTNFEFALFEASRKLTCGLKPNAFSLVQFLRATTDLGYHSFGQQLHSYILRSGYCSHSYISASLVKFYVRMHSLNDAHRLFVETPHLNVVSWNTLISGYVQAGHFRKALSVFIGSHFYADAFSFTSALAAYAELSLLILGRSIHCKIVKSGYVNGTVVANCLIDMYGKCGSVEDAVKLFYEIIEKDVISWNSVIAATAKNGKIELAWKFLHLMPYPDTISYNGLINGIAQVGNIEDAVKVLSSMPNPNSSSWNSVITGFVNRNRAREALDMFCKMHSENMPMDDFTFSIILCGIAALSSLKWGVLIHSCTVKCGFDSSVVVGSALVDMYSKCGQVKNAESIFHALPNRNLVSWNAMISGYARSGDFAQVIQLFESLKIERDINPDDITFLNLLSVCSHDQVPFEVANHYFESMINDHGIAPSIEHCCSMIRLMGQKGELRRAERMIHELGFESYGVVWRALLGACGTQRDLQVAEVAAAKVIELEKNEDYVYVKLSNMYASVGRWEDVSVIRGLMSKKQVRKEAGCSWIESEEFCRDQG
ncbi:PREDICTED: putative pentatricopeptide repeat-containing protein At5g47460 [Lupinus angustifolius]|nr:PREDICTED: putative pentatricopeptide repeat-containing protein At5g47460 [Lupinus angustifolius]